MARPAPTLIAALALACGAAEPVDGPPESPPPGSAQGRPVSCSPPMHGSSIDALELTALGRESFERLRRARRFTDDAIGDGGITPNEVRALRFLFREERAAEAFAALEQQATLPGRLYALCGLYYTDPPRFRERIGAYRDATETVEYQSGCTIRLDQPVAELVSLADGRAVRLEPGESNRTHLERRGVSLRYDIVGGGFPNLFHEGGGWHDVVTEPFDPHAD